MEVLAFSAKAYPSPDPDYWTLLQIGINKGDRLCAAGWNSWPTDPNTDRNHSRCPPLPGTVCQTHLILPKPRKFTEREMLLCYNTESSSVGKTH